MDKSTTTNGHAWVFRRMMGAVMAGFLLAAASAQAQTWVRLTSGTPTNGATGLGGASGNTLFAGFGGAGAYKSTDNGLSWSAVNNGLADAFGGILAPKMFLRTSTGRIIRGGDNASWNNGVGGTVWYSDDAGGSWTMAPYPFGSPTANPGGIAFTDMAELNGAIFATDTLSAGIWKSTDNGVTWTDAGGGLPFTPFTSYKFARGLAAANGKLYVAMPSRGLWRSADGGNTWQEVNSGIPGSDNVLTGVIRVGNDVKALANGTLFAAVDNAVWRSTNEGATWVNVSAGYLGAGEEARRIGVLGNTVYVEVNSGGSHKVVESADQGASWTVIAADGLSGGAVDVLSQTFLAHNGALYVATDTGLFRANLATAPRVAIPPAFTSVPVNVGVNEGMPLTLAYGVAGTPPLSFTWYRDTTLLPSQTSNVLYLASATVNDGGGYWLVASNAGGLASNYVTVTVGGNFPGAPDYTFNAGKGVLTLKKGFMNLFDGSSASRAVQPDGKILIGGDFTQVNGVAANYLVRVNADGTVDTGFNTAVGANGIVRSIAVQADGKVVIGGEFTQVNGVYAARIARLNADGSFDFTFNQGYGLDGVVYGLAVQADGRILLGGNFGSYNQYSSARLARLLPSGEFDPSFRLADPPNNTVETVLAQPDGGIVIGGSFTQLGTTSRQRLGRYNPDLTLDANFNTSSGASSTVRGLLQLADGRLVLAGDFSAYRGTTFAGVVRINGDSTLDGTYSGINNGAAGPWLTNLNNAIGGQAVVASGGTLAIGADLRPFYQATTQRYLGSPPALAILAQPAGAVVRPGLPVTLSVTASGTLAVSYQWRKNGGSLGQTGASLVIASAQAGDAGDYTVVVSNGSGSQTSQVARVVVSNLPVITFASTNVLVAETAYHHIGAQVVGPGPFAYQWYRNGAAIANATNAAITRYGMQRADTGDYTVAVTGPGGTATSAVQRVTVGFIPGHIHDTFGPSSGSSVTMNAAAVLPDGRIIVGGAFTSYAGQNRTNLLVFNADGSIHTAFSARTNLFEVKHIAVQPDGKIIVATGVDQVVRLLPDGALDTNFVIGTAAGVTFAEVRRVAVSKTGKIFALGNFRTWNGVARTNLVMLNPDGSLGPDLGYRNAQLLARSPDGASIAVGSGASLSVDISRLNADGVTDPTFNVRTVDPASCLAFDPQGNLYAAGYFGTVGVGATTYPRSFVAKWLPDGSLDQSFIVDDSIAYIQTVSDMVFQNDGRIIVAGNFTLQTNKPIANLARLNANGKVDTQFSGYLGGANLSALAYYPDGRVVVVGSFTAFNARPKYGTAMFQTERNDPAVVFQPINETVNQGQNATFQVVPVAGDNLTYVWRRNGVIVSGATATLTLTNVTPANSGAYTVEVTSTGGSATYSVGSLVVLGAPEILANPASPDAVTGNPFTLTVNAIGLAPLYYRWARDGTPLGDFTTNAAYTVASAGAGDTGNYTVTVSNALGTATSAGTIVTVITQPGALSTTFSNVLGGTVVGFAIQPDGKIVVAANNQNPGLYRLHPDGTRDTNFVSNVASVSTLRAVALDPQGRIYLGFNTGDLRRYASSGVQESNYMVNVGAVSRTFVVLGLPDGKILVGGDGALLRLNENGSGDNTFTNAIGEVYDLALLPDGKILVANWAGYGYVRRLNPDGSTDLTFNGTVQANQTIYGGLPLPDGRVLAYGQFGSYGGLGKTFLARLLANGQLDNTYSNATPNAFIRRMTLQENGRPVMVGNFSAVGGSNRTFVARLNTDGSLDNTFMPAAPNSMPTLAQVLPDGRILIGGGFSTVGGVAHRGLAVLNGDIVNLAFLRQPVGSVTLNVGSPLSLDVATTATSPVGYQWYRNGAPIPSATAAAYNVGTTTTNDGGLYYVVATNLSGAKTSVVANISILAAPVFLTQPLGTNGYLNKSVTLQASAIGVAPLAVQWLRNGAPIANATNFSLTLTNLQFTNAGAYAMVASNGLGVATSAVANLTVTILQGSADLAFNPGGAGPNSTVNALYTLPDGRIYVAGSFTSFNSSNTNRYIVRLNPDGTLDPSFAYNTNYQATVLAVDLQGRLLAAGGNSLRRILPNGTTDPTFPAAGITFTAPIAAIAVQPDGKILLGGSFTVPAFYLLRLNDDGTRDDTFNPALGMGVDSLLLLPNGSFLAGTYNAGNIQLRRCFADGSLDNSWTSPSFGINGRIYSILPLADGKFLIAGGFSISSRLFLARINSNGTVDTSYTPPALNGSIAQAILQDDGKVVIRGSFDTIGGVVSRNFARLNADLTLDASFVSGFTANNQHNAMALQYDGRIILGGSFTSYDGNNKPYLAAAYGQPVSLAITNPPTAQTLNLNAPLTLTAGVFAAGPVTYQWFKNGAPISGATGATLNIAQVKSTDSGLYTVQVSDGTNTRTSPGATVTVLGAPLFVRQPASLVTTQGWTAAFAPIVQGQAPITYQWWFNGAPLANATNMNLSLASVSAAQAGQYRLAATNAIGGALSASANLSVNVLPAGTVDPNFATNSGGNNTISAIAVAPGGGMVYAGGTFSFFDGSSRVNFVRLNPDGTRGTNYQPNMGGSLYAMGMQADGKLLVGGAISSVTDQNGVVTMYALARLQTNGFVDRSFTNLLNNGSTVYGIRPHNGGWLVGGWFTNVGGLVRSNLARLNADGTPDAAFGAANLADNIVQTMTVDAQGRVLIGGHFTSMLGQPRTRIARLTAAGALDTTFTNTLGANQTVRAIAVQTDGKILVGGDFTQFSGGARNYLVRLNEDGSVDATFPTMAGSVVSEIEVLSDGKIIIAGSFTTLNTGAGYFSHNRLARLHSNGALDTTFAILSPNAGVSIVEPQPDGSLLVGGSFGSIGGLARGNLARLLPDGQLAPLITAQPAGITANVGEAAVLSVGVAGLNPLRFQWRKDGTNVPGATSATLNLANLTTNSAGNYTVVITNSAGAVTSAVAAVSVSLGAGYAAWAAGQQLPPGLEGPGADADGDGVPNIVEYALGTNPKLAGARQFPANHLVRLGNQDYPALRVIRLKGAAGLSIEVEAATNVTFSALVGTTQEGPAEDLGDGTERVTIRVNTPLTQTPVMFFRAKLVAQ